MDSSDQAPEFATLQNVVAAAHEKLPEPAWDYLAGGTETETSVARNRLALDRLALRPRVMRDVSDIDSSGKVLGHKVRMPVTLAPMGSIEMLHPDGALPVATAAEEFGVVSYLSSVAQPGIEKIIEATSHPKVFQLYVRGDDDWVIERARTAKEAGFIALCITVDLAVYSRRERDKVKGFLPTARARGTPGQKFQSHVTWDLIDKLKDLFDWPIFIKGIGTAEDAALACEHGCEAIYMSNHGGRALDHGLGMMDILPDAVQAVAGRAEIVVDGGIMRGTDVIKALALGADSVAIGRLHGFGLAAGGHAGIMRVLDLLEEELRTSMALMGVSRISDLGPECLAKAESVVTPTTLSAFPFYSADKG